MLSVKDYTMGFSLLFFAVLILAATLPIIFTSNWTTGIAGDCDSATSSGALAGLEEPTTIDGLRVDDAVVPSAAAIVSEQPAVATITTIARGFRKTKDRGCSVRGAPKTVRKDGERKRLPQARKVVKFETLADRVTREYAIEKSALRAGPTKSILKKPNDIKKGGPCSHNRTITFGQNDTKMYYNLAILPYMEDEFDACWLPESDFLASHQEALNARIAEKWSNAAKQLSCSGTYEDPLPSLTPIVRFYGIWEMWPAREDTDPELLEIYYGYDGMRERGGLVEEQML